MVNFFTPKSGRNIRRIEVASNEPSTTLKALYINNLAHNRETPEKHTP